MEWMILPLKRYARFRGRSRRMEYWMFALFSGIVGLIAATVDRAVGWEEFGIDTATTLVLFLPSIAVTVRRLHDVGWSGWWLMVLILPLALMMAFVPDESNDQFPIPFTVALGFLLLSFVGLVVLTLMPGMRGPNRFGPDPKNPDDELREVFR